MYLYQMYILVFTCYKDIVLLSWLQIYFSYCLLAMSSFMLPLYIYIVY
uniref:Uncharacterized protein n=1 Tax=Anguilla anguilla TaxID=7936 RepID=A0A0E9PEF7_ANGAN